LIEWGGGDSPSQEWVREKLVTSCEGKSVAKRERKEGAWEGKYLHTLRRWKSKTEEK